MVDDSKLPNLPDGNFKRTFVRPTGRFLKIDNEDEPIPLVDEDDAPSIVRISSSVQSHRNYDYNSFDDNDDSSNLSSNESSSSTTNSDTTTTSSDDDTSSFDNSEDEYFNFDDYEVQQKDIQGIYFDETLGTWVIPNLNSDSDDEDMNVSSLNISKVLKETKNQILIPGVFNNNAIMVHYQNLDYKRKANRQQQILPFFDVNAPWIMIYVLKVTFWLGNSLMDDARVTFAKGARPNLQQSTIETYKNSLKIFLNWLEAATDEENINDDDANNDNVSFKFMKFKKFPEDLMDNFSNFKSYCSNFENWKLMIQKYIIFLSFDCKIVPNTIANKLQAIKCLAAWLVKQYPNDFPNDKIHKHTETLWHAWKAFGTIHTYRRNSRETMMQLKHLKKPITLLNSTLKVLNEAKNILSRLKQRLVPTRRRNDFVYSISNNSSGTITSSEVSILNSAIVLGLLTLQPPGRAQNLEIFVVTQPVVQLNCLGTQKNFNLLFIDSRKKEISLKVINYKGHNSSEIRGDGYLYHLHPELKKFFFEFYNVVFQFFPKDSPKIRRAFKKLLGGPVFYGYTLLRQTRNLRRPISKAAASSIFTKQTGITISDWRKVVETSVRQSNSLPEKAKESISTAMLHTKDVARLYYFKPSPDIVASMVCTNYTSFLNEEISKSKRAGGRLSQLLVPQTKPIDCCCCKNCSKVINRLRAEIKQLRSKIFYDSIENDDTIRGLDDFLSCSSSQAIDVSTQSEVDTTEPKRTQRIIPPGKMVKRKSYSIKSSENNDDSGSSSSFDIDNYYFDLDDDDDDLQQSPQLSFRRKFKYSSNIPFASTSKKRPLELSKCVSTPPPRKKN